LAFGGCLAFDWRALGGRLSFAGRATIAKRSLVVRSAWARRVLGMPRVRMEDTEWALGRRLRSLVVCWAGDDILGVSLSVCFAFVWRFGGHRLGAWSARGVRLSFSGRATIARALGARLSCARHERSACLAFAWRTPSGRLVGAFARLSFAGRATKARALSVSLSCARLALGVSSACALRSLGGQQLGAWSALAFACRLLGGRR